MGKFTIAALLAVAAASAHAGGTFDSTGTAKGTSQSDIFPIAENHMIMHSQTEYDSMDMSAANHPFNGMTGSCFGAIEIKVPAASGSGNCAFADGDGDLSASRWIVTGMTPEGALTGSWTVIGGTGKFAGSTGGGGFEMMNDRENGTFENMLAGAVTLR
ncbi:MAG: hypothetical protein NXH97_03895 [Rhodobacteraceae bacterium]|nr:hypothetical protein [Paracoccaceae bacterium]